MPIFEYECNQCGQRTEHLQLSSSAPLTACPECNGEVRKLMSAPAFQFKGSGWYVTDYADKGKSKDGAASSGGDGAKDTTAGASDGGDSTKAKEAAPSGGAASEASSKTSSAKTSSAKTASPSD